MGRIGALCGGGSPSLSSPPSRSGADNWTAIVGGAASAGGHAETGGVHDLQIKQGGDALRVAATTLSVNGSSRTARNAAWAELQKRFYDSQRPLSGPKRRKTIEKGLNDLEQRMKSVDSCC